MNSYLRLDPKRSDTSDTVHFSTSGTSVPVSDILCGAINNVSTCLSVSVGREQCQHRRRNNHSLVNFLPSTINLIPLKRSNFALVGKLASHVTHQAVRSYSFIKAIACNLVTAVVCLATTTATGLAI